MYYPPNNDQPAQQGFYPPNSYQSMPPGFYPSNQQGPSFSPQPDQFVPPSEKGKGQKSKNRKRKGGGKAGIGCALLVVLVAVSAFLLVMGGRVQSFSSLVSGVVIATGTPPIPTRPPILSSSQPATTSTSAIPTLAPTPTQPPMPTSPPHGVNGNPWGYDFTPGKYITVPPVAFCKFFTCNPGFARGIGYVVECQDGTYEKSGGVAGSCVLHGGPQRPLYSH